MPIIAITCFTTIALTIIVITISFKKLVVITKEYFANSTIVTNRFNLRTISSGFKTNLGTPFTTTITIILVTCYS